MKVRVKEDGPYGKKGIVHEWDEATSKQAVISGWCEPVEEKAQAKRETATNGGAGKRSKRDA